MLKSKKSIKWIVTLVVTGLLVSSLVLSGCIQGPAGPAGPAGATGAAGAAGKAAPAPAPKVEEVQTYNIKVSCENPITFLPDGPVWNKFEELMEDYSDGRIEVEVFYDGSLYGNLDVTPAVISGAVDMAGPAPSHIGHSITPNGQMFDLPAFIGVDATYMLRVLRETEVGPRIQAEVEDHGLMVPGFYSSGDKAIMFSLNGPLRTLDDFEGMTMRSPAGALSEAIMTTLGAAPVTIAFSESFMAHKTGVVDGGVTSMPGVYASKWYEIGGDVTWTQHLWFWRVPIMNLSSFESLPAELRWMLRAAFNEIIPSADVWDKEAVISSKKKLEEEMGKPVILLTRDEANDFAEALLPVEEEFVASFGIDPALLQVAKDFLAALP